MSGAGWGRTVREPLRYAFKTLGCKVNQTESEAADAMLRRLGAVPAEEATAEVIVVNTCTVTGEADRKARKAVRHALGMPGRPVVVVTGCLAALDAAGLAALDPRVVVEADKERLAQRVLEAVGQSAAGTVAGRPMLGHTGPLAVTPAPTAASEATRTRVQVKVQDGCDAFCSYCIVPYARGVPRSVPLGEVVARVRELVAEGVREVVLTGINIGRYDDSGARLPDLIEAVAATGVARVRLSSIEPGDVDERLLAAAVAIPAFCAHLHVPLQAGSDRVLAAMGRPYDTAAFARVLARARAALPHLALSTDVIVGFPGETDEDAAASLAFVASQGFSRLHVFRYSARPGTPAADLAGQVPATIKAARAAAMRSLGVELSSRFEGERAAAGSPAELLVERVRPASAERPRTVEGTTREYLHLAVASPAAKPGDLLEVCWNAPAGEWRTC
jgi:threonylcarbamoyladenosine tRNA methylthiotransferase MtaB